MGFAHAIPLNVIGIIEEIADDRVASLREEVLVRKEASETCRSAAGSATMHPS